MPAEMSHAVVAAEEGIIQRAIAVTEPAEWIGFFEWFTFARLLPQIKNSYHLWP